MPLHAYYPTRRIVTQTPVRRTPYDIPVKGECMNKRKKVAWRKHRVKAKKAEEKRKANRGRTA